MQPFILLVMEYFIHLRPNFFMSLAVLNLVIVVGENNPDSENILVAIKDYSKYSSLTNNTAILARWRASFLLDLKNSRVRKHYPSEISNLNEYLSSFFHKHSLIIIDNHARVTWDPFDSPFILRTPTQFTALHPELEHFLPIWFPEVIIRKNLSFIRETNGVSSCPNSKFFVNTSGGTMSSSELCFRIDMPSYSMQTKPWSGYVHISLFPPTHNEIATRIKWMQPSAFELSKQNHLLYSSFPSNVPSFHSIVHIENKLRQLTNGWLSAWFPSEYDRKDKYVHENKAFILATSGNATSCTCNITKFHDIIISSVCKIGTIQVLTLGKNRGGYKFLIDGATQVLFGDLGNYTTLLALTLPPEDKNVVSFSSSLILENNVLGYMVDALHNCSYDVLHPRVAYLSSNPVEGIGKSYAYLWLSMVLNYSAIKVDLRVCHDGMKKKITKESTLDNINVHLKPYLRGQYFFSLVPHDKHSNLYFVSCGKRGMTAIPFRELMNVYDNWVWLLIATSAIALALSLTSSSDIVTHFISTLKVLLEQGNPFLKQVVDNPRLRCTAGLFMLMGIILSNAYKNNNVYNMITVRKPIPYEYLEDLVEDNVVVYARHRLIDVYYGFLFDNSALDLLFKHFLNETGNHIGPVTSLEGDFAVISEVSSAIMTYFLLATGRANDDLATKNLTKYFEDVVRNSAIAKTDKTDLRRISRLHPSINKFALEISLSLPWYVADPEIVEMLAEFEKDFMFELLRKCRGTALILPKYLCEEHVKVLKEKHNLKHAFVGKESYSDIQWMFQLSGIIPPHIFNRIKSASETGLWLRWNKLASRLISLTHETPVAANLQGNVVVIFILFLLGQGCASLCFVLEIYILSVKTFVSMIGKFCCTTQQGFWK